MKDRTLGKPKKQIVHPNLSNEILGQPNSKESVALADFRAQKGTVDFHECVDEKVPEESSITSPHEEPQKPQQKQ